MAFLPLPDETNAPLESRGVLHDTRERWGFLPDIVRALAIRPDIMRAEDQWSKAVMYSGLLPRALKEAVATAVSVANGCDYCATSHAYQAQREGAPVTLREACRRLDFSGLPAREGAALDFAVQAARDMRSIRPAHLHGLRAWFSDQEIVELVCVVSSFMMYNTFVSVLGLQVESHVHGEGLLGSER